MKANGLPELLGRVQVDENGCWRWQGGKFSNGYGAFCFENRTQKTHRASWLLHRGPIPAGLLVCHSCDVRDCVNPAHLFLGSAKDNQQDMVAKERWGSRGKHEWTEASRERASEAARNRYDRMSDEERAALGAAMGASRRGKRRGPYKGRTTYANGYKPVEGAAA